MVKVFFYIVMVASLVGIALVLAGKQSPEKAAEALPKPTVPVVDPLPSIEEMQAELRAEQDLARQVELDARRLEQELDRLREVSARTAEDAAREIVLLKEQHVKEQAAAARKQENLRKKLDYLMQRSKWLEQELATAKAELRNAKELVNRGNLPSGVQGENKTIYR